MHTHIINSGAAKDKARAVLLQIKNTCDYFTGKKKYINRIELIPPLFDSFKLGMSMIDPERAEQIQDEAKFNDISVVRGSMFQKTAANIVLKKKVVHE